MSVNVESLKAAVEIARRQNAYAKSLNCRGGSFKTYSLQQHFAERLRSVGATCLTGLDPSILALPPLDAAEIRRVEAESPSTITLCGINLPIVYSQYAQPEVVMQEVDAIHTCQEWPSQILLLSGKNVYLRVVDQRGATILWGVDLAEQRSQLIDTVRDHMINAIDWEEFIHPDDGTNDLHSNEIGMHPITKQTIVVGYWWEGEPGWRYKRCMEISAAKERITKLKADALIEAIRQRSKALSAEILQIAENITDSTTRWWAQDVGLLPYAYESSPDVWIKWEQKAKEWLDTWQAKIGTTESIKIPWMVDATSEVRVTELGGVKDQGAQIISGRLYPGNSQVVGISATNRGGSRYTAEIVAINGVETVEQIDTVGKRHNLTVIGVGQPGWTVSFRHLKDGVPYSYTLATTSGVAEIRESDWEECGWTRYVISLEGPSMEEILSAHGLVQKARRSLPQPSQAVQTVQTPSAPPMDLQASLGALAAKFGGAKRARR